MDEQSEWLAKALRSQDIAAKIAALLNEIAEIDPDAVCAQVHGPGFSISGVGPGFRVNSLLSADDLRAIQRGRITPGGGH